MINVFLEKGMILLLNQTNKKEMKLQICDAGCKDDNCKDRRCLVPITDRDARKGGGKGGGADAGGHGSHGDGDRAGVWIS